MADYYKWFLGGRVDPHSEKDTAWPDPASGGGWFKMGGTRGTLLNKQPSFATTIERLPEGIWEELWLVDLDKPVTSQGLVHAKRGRLVKRIDAWNETAATSFTEETRALRSEWVREIYSAGSGRSGTDRAWTCVPVVINHHVPRVRRERRFARSFDQPEPHRTREPCGRIRGRGCAGGTDAGRRATGSVCRREDGTERRDIRSCKPGACTEAIGNRRTQARLRLVSDDECRRGRRTGSTRVMVPEQVWHLIHVGRSD
jgi:hypothetical protein